MQIQRSASTPSNIDRPQSNLSNRPVSRASVTPTLRPSSSLGHARPISRVSQRPASRLSQRPASRQSHHAPAHSQISAKVSGLIHTLVTQITGITSGNDPENYKIACDYASKHLELGMLGISGVVGVGWDMKKADSHLTGLVKKAKVHSYDNLASAVDATYKRLKERVEKNVDLDAEVKASRLPDHLQFLATLSLPPDQSTHEFAESYLQRVYNPQKIPGPLTWAEILAEEPFHGQHWEGVYGLPPGSTVEGWEVQSSGSSPSLSPWDDDMDDPSHDRGSDSLSFAGSLGSMQLEEDEGPLRIEGGRDNDDAILKDVPEFYQHRQAFEDFQARQYWRPEWRTPADLDRPFSLGDHSTLAPSLNRMQKGSALGIFGAAAHEKYIPEHYAVREVLMGLQSFENFMFSWMDWGEHLYSYQASKSPRLMHLTTDSQQSIISAFAHLATTLQHLRRFVSTVFAKAAERSKSDEGDKVSYILNFRRRNSRTLEAFADAVDFEVRRFDVWCSAREKDIRRAQRPCATDEQPLVVSLLSLEKSVRDEFGTLFDTLKGILQDVTEKASISRRHQVHFARSSITDPPAAPIWDLTEIQNNVPPALITTHLLNALLRTVREQDLMGEATISAILMRVFSKSAEPVWSMIGAWIRDGVPIHDLSTLGAPAISEGSGGNGQGGIDDEFFIEDNEMPLLDPDFWAEGCTLRNDGSGVSQVLPVFVEHVAQDVLSAGKAVGLLRALGGYHQPEDSGDTDTTPTDASAGWKEFEVLIRESASFEEEDEETIVLPTSAEALSGIVHDDLHPRYLSAQLALTKVLLEDCELEHHLNVMEDCYFMRRGEVMNHFLDSLFAKMDSQQAWFDFHFLNSVFRDVVEMSYHRWIDPSLVRLSYQDSPDKATTRSVRGLDPLFVEYAVPFPLTYICGPKGIQSYSAIFVWLTQIKRARSLLENTVLRGSGVVSGDPHHQAEMKAFYALRNKLSWFVNTLLDYVLTYVIQIEVRKFHKRLREVESLDGIIQLHSEHVESVKNLCFLQQKAASIYRSILSILDISLYFTECFATFKGESPQDSVSRSRDVSTSLRVRRHRSKLLRRMRRNTIDFSRDGRVHEGGGIDPGVESSDSEQDEEEEGYGMEPPSFIGDTAISFAEENAFTRVDKMSRELDGLIRFVRRGVENLSGKGGPESSTFGVLSFALEDWDR